MKTVYILTLICALTYAISENENATETFVYSENPSIRRFQEYLQIDTSQPENLHEAVEFWRRQAQDLGLTFNVYEPAGKPICVLTLEGTNSSLPSIMLNSHMDVVPVEPCGADSKMTELSNLVHVFVAGLQPWHRLYIRVRGVTDASLSIVQILELSQEAWTYPPFSGYMDRNGDIYGRGAQDTKDIAIQYLEVFSMLKQNNITLQRTLHITIMPDEEVGGSDGIKAFIKMNEFQELNIGFALDEGMPSKDDTMYALYVDKRPWEMEFTIEGKSGHGSSLEEGTAMQKVAKLIDIVMKLRDEQMEVQRSTNSDASKYTAVNINMIHGGVARNVIPSQFTVVIDMRLAVDANVTAMEAMVNSWVQTAGPNVTMKFLCRVDEAPATPVDDSNSYWVAMRDAAKELNIIIKPIVFQAITDMTSVRSIGIPALGFKPATRTELLAHAFDERLSADSFLHGIQVYAKILESLGNLPA